MAEYQSNATQQEKLEALQHDSYHSRAQHNVNDAGGRFQTLTSTTVIGTAGSSVQQQPDNSPWAQGFDQNVEPALGFSVDEMPAVGTPAEVQASLGAAAARTEAGTPPTPSVETPAASNAEPTP